MIKKIKNMILNNTIKNTLVYTSSTYLERSIGFIRGFLIAKYLGPVLLGIWGIINLIKHWSRYLNFGVIYSMNREIAMNKNYNREYKEKIENNSFYFILGISFLILFAGFLAKTIDLNGYMKYNFIYRNSFLISIILAFDQLYVFFENYYRAHEKFLSLALGKILFSITSLIIVIFFVRKFEIIAVLYSLIISYVVSIGYFIMKTDKKFKFKIDRKIISYLLKIGISLMVYTLGYFAFNSIDKIMIAKFLEKKYMGYYTFAFSINSAILILIQSVTYILYPKILNKTKQAKDKNEYYKLFKTYTNYVVTIIPFIIFMAYVTVGYFITTFLSEYIESIIVIRIILLGQFFLFASSIMNNILIGKNKQKMLTKLLIKVILLSIVLNYFAIKLGMSIMGISMATSISYLVYGFMQLFLGLRYFEFSFKNSIMEAVKIYRRYFIFLLIIIYLTYNWSLVNLIISFIMVTLLYLRRIIEIIEDF